MSAIVNPNPSSAAVYNIPELDAGSDYTLGVQVQDGNGNPINLSGSNTEIFSQIKEAWHLPVLANFTISPVSLSGGQFNLVLYGSDSINLVPNPVNKPYVYDVVFQTQDGSGNITSRSRLLQGTVNVIGNISHV
jgi:hypothetical protein